MKHKNNKKEISFIKKNIYLIIVCFLLLSLSTIGYSALNQKLYISGDLALRAVKDIRISDLKLVETLSGGYEQYNSKYTADTITITSALEYIFLSIASKNGSITLYKRKDLRKSSKVECPCTITFLFFL